MPDYDFLDRTERKGNERLAAGLASGMALARKMAYDKEQDKLKNFLLFGGQDPALVMQGSSQASALGDEKLANFQDALAYGKKDTIPYRQPPTEKEFNAPADRAYQSFKDMLSSKKSGRLSLEDQIALIRERGEQARETKETPAPGASKDDTLRKLQAAERALSARLKEGEDVGEALNGVRNKILDYGGIPEVATTVPQKPGKSAGDWIPGVEGKQEKWERLFGNMYPENKSDLSSEDKQALEWANSNPKDPRSAAILKRLAR